MAQQITLVDDIDDSTENVETRGFVHDGKAYTIDLGPETWEMLHKAQASVAKFVEAATEVPVKRVRRDTALNRLSTEDKKQIRKDLGKGPRGTIPDAEVEKWLGRPQEPETVAAEAPVSSSRAKRS